MNVIEYEDEKEEVTIIKYEGRTSPMHVQWKLKWDFEIITGN